MIIRPNRFQPKAKEPIVTIRQVSGGFVADVDHRKYIPTPEGKSGQMERVFGGDEEELNRRLRVALWRRN